MKRRIALFLFVMMLCTVFIPIQSLAGTTDSGLEKAIKSVKVKITIPSDYVFSNNYYVYTQNGKNIWQLAWNSKDEGKGTINVNVDEDGVIYNYYAYKYSDNYDYSKKRLPKVTEDKAQTYAWNFIKKVNRNAIAKVKLIENQSANSGYDYNFNYTRVANDIPFYNNGIYISVNSQTGEVTNYNYNWNDELTFPAINNVISLKDAQNAYKEKLGLRLVYKYAYDNKKITVYPAYVPKYDNYYFAIDAVTGEKIQTGYSYLYGMGGSMNEKQVASTAADNIVITPEEQNAIEEASKIIDKEDAEKIARGLDVLKLTDEYKLGYISLYREWYRNNGYIWNMSFSKGTDSKDDRYVSVSLDALTGDILNFNTGYNYDENAEPKYDQAAAKKAVEDFLKKIQPDRFSQTEYDDSANMTYGTGNEKPKTFTFNYTRKVNGILFPDNAMSAAYDAVNGEIIGFDMRWFNDAEFPAVAAGVSSDKSYNTLFNSIGLELQYKEYYAEEASNIAPKEPVTKPEIRPVYAVKQDKTIILDPSTGAILKEDGKPYVEEKPAQYTDIAGNPAETQIKVLAQIGIFLEGTEFKPNEKITQKDFLELLTKSMNNVYVPYDITKDQAKYIEYIYSNLIAGNIVKDSEKNPDAKVTREDGVKFIIRALKYDKVAEIPGIFKSTFKDADKINAALTGYVAIAQGLKIVNGTNGYFYPDKELTRAEAAIIIYNYLQV